MDADAAQSWRRLLGCGQCTSSTHCWAARHTVRPDAAWCQGHGCCLPVDDEAHDLVGALQNAVLQGVSRRVARSASCANAHKIMLTSGYFGSRRFRHTRAWLHSEACPAACPQHHAALPYRAHGRSTALAVAVVNAPRNQAAILLWMRLCFSLTTRRSRMYRSMGYSCR